MIQRSKTNWGTIGMVWILSLWLLGFGVPARADSVQHTGVIVMVTDAETSQPIYQAHLTLQFREPGQALKLKRSKPLAYSAKTDTRGRYRFTQVPMGTIRLIVTADHHQTFSQEFELEKSDQVFEVKLKKPQPLL